MSYENWKDKISTFEVMDVRGQKAGLLPRIEGKGCRTRKTAKDCISSRPSSPFPYTRCWLLWALNITRRR